MCHSFLKTLWLCAVGSRVRQALEIAFLHDKSQLFSRGLGFTIEQVRSQTAQMFDSLFAWYSGSQIAMLCHFIFWASSLCLNQHAHQKFLHHARRCCMLQACFQQSRLSWAAIPCNLQPLMQMALSKLVRIPFPQILAYSWIFELKSSKREHLPCRQDPMQLSMFTTRSIAILPSLAVLCEHRVWRCTLFLCRSELSQIAKRPSFYGMHYQLQQTQSKSSSIEGNTISSVAAQFVGHS